MHRVVSFAKLQSCHYHHPRYLMLHKPALSPSCMLQKPALSPSSPFAFIMMCIQMTNKRTHQQHVIFVRRPRRVSLQYGKHTTEAHLLQQACNCPFCSSIILCKAFPQSLLKILNASPLGAGSVPCVTCPLLHCQKRTYQF
jgi:hypothetical protein